MLDISRDRVPSMQTLYELIDLFAELKMNQLQLYTEHTFAYRDHREVWADWSPITAEQAMELDEYCRDNLAGFKVPKEVRFLDELPHNATGKIIKHMLPRED